jgi:CheY-like chemotaxis protein
MDTGKAILVVEDNPNDILLLQRAFRKANIQNPLRIVNDGQSAIDYLAGEEPYADRRQHPLPGLLLLDLKLPRRSGHEILSWLRQQAGIGQMTTVVLSSSKESEDIDRAYAAGANSYLVKPVAFDELLTMIKTLNLYWLTFNETPNVKTSL